jgi:hypothetical protein
MIILPRLMNPRSKSDAGNAGRQSGASGSGARGERAARIACREWIEALAQRSGLMNKDYSAIVAHPAAREAGITAEMLLTLWQGQVQQVFDAFVDANWPRFDTVIAEAEQIAETATLEASADQAFHELMKIVDEEIAKVIREKAQTLDA